jgi:hypothetical protein
MLVFACVSSGVIWLIWWVHFGGRHEQALPYYRLPVEVVAIATVSVKRTALDLGEINDQQ